MNTYFVRYWTVQGHIIGLTVSAWSAMQAQEFVQNMPDFSSICSVDWQ